MNEWNKENVVVFLSRHLCPNIVKKRRETGMTRKPGELTVLANMNIINKEKVKQ